MDLDADLSAAFAQWSQARDELGRLRDQLGTGGEITQLANSPETAELFRQLAAQQQLCDDSFAALLAIAERRAASIEHEWTQRVGSRAREPGR